MSKYSRVFTLGLKNSMEYRTNFFFSIISAIFPIIIQIYLWTAIFNSSDSEIIYGYTYIQLILYSILASIISKLMTTGIENEISEDIKSGNLSKFLVQPIAYFLYKICSSYGQKIYQFILMFIFLGLCMYIFNIFYNMEINFINFLFMLPIIFLSLLLSIIVSCVFSLLAFWLTEAWAAFMILGILVNVVSGGIFPLDIFGDKAVRVLNLFPFNYMVYFPINVFCNRIVGNDILIGVIIQIIWIIVLIILLNVFWSLGLKKFTATGG